MSSLAHCRVTIDVYGTGSTILHTSSLYCSTDATGGHTVKKWAREEAAKQGITLIRWDYLRHDRALEWEGRVYGKPTSGTAD